jgi:hypothetical protein
VLIDGNAGDGHGVEQPQTDLFGDNPSCPTAEMLLEFAVNDGNADVVLCEADAERRAELAARFPEAVIVRDHALAPEYVRDHVYALWLSDPCGPSGHGVDHMRAIADRVRSDFVIAFNEGWITTRLQGTTSGRWQTSRERYLPMSEPFWWTRHLNRRRLARTRHIIHGAANFRYRVLVVANYLAQGATREPFEEVV